LALLLLLPCVAAPLLLDDLSHSKLQPWDGVVAYARDKRRQVALAEHLADIWRDKGKRGREQSCLTGIKHKGSQA
jgi:hypothetical protein